MDFALTEDQRQLRESLRRYLRERHPSDPAVWRSFAHDLGILSLAEEANRDPVSLMVVMEELGEALSLAPFCETVVTGAAILNAAGGATAAALVAAIAAGDVRLALAWAEPGARGAIDPRDTVATPDGDGWRIDGAKSLVAGAPDATHLIVTARTDQGSSLFVVPANAPGLAATMYRTIDARGAADVQFDGVRLPGAALLGTAGDGRRLFDEARAWTIAAQGAELVGAMRAMLRATLDYCGQRRQFGQTLADFQALQHRMTDMYGRIEMAASAVYLATLSLRAPAAERDRAAAVAKVTTGEAARFVGQNAIQLHGGMGMTDELPVSRHFRRATVLEAEFGTTAEHLSWYAADIDRGGTSVAMRIALGET